MSRIRMKVFIHNETDATLTYTGGELVSGDYTEGWTPPSAIYPGERKGFQGEGDIVPVDVPISGTEGRVRYDIVGGDGELYIHWNSPLIESQYGNTFHIWAPPDWEISHWGGQGHHAELEIRLRRTQIRSVPNFHAVGRAFKFTNTWDSSLPAITLGYLWNRLLEALPEAARDMLEVLPVDENWLPITHANAGLCGGMVYAVMDYYHHHLLPPAQSAAPNTVDDPLYQYIRDRLVDSFGITGDGTGLWRILPRITPMVMKGSSKTLLDCLKGGHGSPIEKNGRSSRQILMPGVCLP
ncbi:hypothetical protein HC928_23605 [bacterium]|nr:hypothetical protein [bacterium]